MLCFEPTVSESFGIPTSLCDASGQRLLVSDQYSDLLMRSKDDLLRMPWQTIIHPDDFKQLSVPFGRLISRAEPYELHCRVLRGDGVWLHLHYRVMPHDRQGERITFQTNISIARTTTEHEANIPAPDAAALAEYIREHAQQLGLLAAKRKMAMVHHFLALASAEAGEEVVRMSEKIMSSKRLLQHALH